MRYLITLLFVLTLTGCGQKNGEEAGDTAGGSRVVIGVSVLTLTHSFFQDLTDTLKEEAERNGMEVILTSCEFDIARQQNQISDFIVQRVDAMVLAPCDSKAVGTSIAEANKAGIPVFTVDIAALAEGVDVVTHIATDNYSGGRLAAEAVLEAIGRSGQVAIIDHPEVESVILRTRGFLEVINEANAENARLEVVAQLPASGVQDRAFRVAEDILQAHADLDAIFAINDQTALGAVAALEKSGRSGQVKVIGFDGTLEGKQAIRDGKVYADVIQHPDEIGKSVVMAIIGYMAGETLPKEILIPATIYRQADTEADPVLQTEGAK